MQLSDGSTYDQTGRVESISGVIDTSTGSVSLRACPNPNGLLPAAARATSSAEHLQGLHRRSAGERSNSRTKYMYIKGGRQGLFGDDRRREDLERPRVYSTRGLVPGDVIVAEGVGLLREGTPIVRGPGRRPRRSSAPTAPPPKPKPKRRNNL
ncbi:MAG: hypothetical protein ACLRMJ_12380 [Alistipes finegoldii]